MKLLVEYSTISISFEVSTELQVCPVNNGLGGLQLVEKLVAVSGRSLR